MMVVATVKGHPARNTDYFLACLVETHVPLPESHDFPSVFLAGCNRSFQISDIGSIVVWFVVKF